MDGRTTYLKVELTVDEIRQMMNQESRTMVEMSGAIVPLNIAGLTWLILMVITK
jgi:hypothetical protein